MAHCPLQAPLPPYWLPFTFTGATPHTHGATRAILAPPPCCTKNRGRDPIATQGKRNGDGCGCDAKEKGHDGGGGDDEGGGGPTVAWLAITEGGSDNDGGATRTTVGGEDAMGKG